MNKVTIKNNILSLTKHNSRRYQDMWKQFHALQKKVRAHWKTRKTSVQILEEERGK